MKQEIEILKEQMIKTKLSVETYQEVLDVLNNVLNPQILFNNWNVIKTQMKNEILNVLQICSELLPTEEDLIPDEDINQIIKNIDEFEKEIMKGNFSEDLKCFVVEQLVLMRESIFNYKIQGSKAFAKSYFNAQTVFFSNVKIFKDDDSKTVLRKVGGLWNKILAVYNKVGKSHNMLNDGVKLLGAGEKVLDKFLDGFN